MTTDYHSKTEQLFANFLQSEKGYPKDAIVYDSEWLSIDGKRKFRPDFILYEPNRKERLAIIEIKDAKIANGKNIYDQLNGFRQAIEKSNLPIYLVTPSYNSTDDNQMDLYTFDETGMIKKIDISLFPTFLALSSVDSVNRKDTLRVEGNATEKTFKIVSWSSATMLFVLTVADYILSTQGITLLTPERLTLIGAVIGLVIMPFIQKFKGLGIEWEREKQ